MEVSMRKYKWMSVIPAVFIMILIFCFSAQEAEESTITSTAVGRFVVELQMGITGTDIPPELIEKRAVEIDEYVRKGAHMTEYAILGLALLFPFTCFQVKSTIGYFIASMIGVVYAASDEFHQTFVRGRSGCIRDVVIDATGVILALAITRFIARLTKTLQKKKHNFT